MSNINLILTNEKFEEKNDISKENIPTDIDLMLYQKRIKNQKRSLLIQLLLFSNFLIKQ
jgi:hypothetical protein